MRCVFHHTCKPRSKRATYDAENIWIEVDVPFVPFPGLNVKLTPHGDYVEVEDVWLDITGGEGLCAYLKEPDDGPEFHTFAEMKAEGWKVGRAPLVGHAS